MEAAEQLARLPLERRVRGLRKVMESMTTEERLLYLGLVLWPSGHVPQLTAKRRTQLAAEVIPGAWSRREATAQRRARRKARSTAL